MKKHLKKIFSYLLIVNGCLLPLCANTNCAKQIINSKDETLNLVFDDCNINTFTNESYQSQEIFGQYQNNYHDCDFEIVNPLP